MGLRTINQIAEAELGAMVVSGRSAQSTPLTLTGTQQARRKGEQQRAAAAKAAASGGKSGNPQQQPQPTAQPQPAAAATVIDGIRRSSTMGPWAKGCMAWATGPCSMGHQVLAPTPGSADAHGEQPANQRAHHLPGNRPLLCRMPRTGRAGQQGKHQDGQQPKGKGIGGGAHGNT